MHKFKNKIFKDFLIFIYEYYIFFIILISLLKKKNSEVKIFYSGGISGNIGGTKVKIQRLKKIFQESKLNFNIVYVLSNAPYLNNLSIKLLKFKKIPIVLNQNGVFYPAWYDGNWSKKNKKIEYIYNKADYIFYQSNFCKIAADKFLIKNQRCYLIQLT